MTTRLISEKVLQTLQKSKNFFNRYVIEEGVYTIYNGKELRLDNPTIVETVQLPTKEEVKQVKRNKKTNESEYITGESTNESGSPELGLTD